MLIQHPYRANHAHCELCRAHFHGKHSHRQAMMDSNILTDIHGQRGFTHRRPPGNDDQIALLEPRSHPIKIDKAGGHPGDLRIILALIELINALNDLLEHRLDLEKPLTARSEEHTSEL